MNYEENVVTYFEKISVLVDEISHQSDDIEKTMNLMALEEHMNNENTEELNVNPISDHPYIALCEFYRKEAYRVLEKILKIKKVTFTNTICQEIINTLYNNRLKVNLYKGGEDYVGRFDKLRNTFRRELFEEYGSLTEIQDIRLIEKIESLANGKRNMQPRIAVLGHLKKTDEFEPYLHSKEIFPKIDEFLYQSKDVFYCAAEDRLVELKNIISLKGFLQEYDMIFFLDESYFYKRNQSSKSRDEKQAALYVDIYWKWFQGQQGELNLETVSYLFNMYDEALRFLKSADSSISAEREWDSQLLNYLEALEQKYDDCAEVYIYIGNSRIGEGSIEHHAVCKEEYYDGKSLYVYKIASDKREGDKDWNDQNENSVESSVTYVNGSSVDIWKFVKSISNNFYKESFGKPDIEAWKNSRIEFIDGEQGESKEDFCVFFRFDHKVSPEMKVFLKELMQIISDVNQLPCIRSYLKDLFYSAVLSRADSVAGLILAYKIHHCKNISFKESDSIHERETKGIILNTYKARKAYYSIIERLSYVRIHDFDQVERILKFDFKTRFAEFLSDEQFIDLIIEIKENCEYFGDRDSRLYLYSNAFAKG